MAKHLLIVESPAKAKTIEKILGKDFTVKSSYGHIRDLIKDSKDKKAIEVDNGYKPNYAISSGKQKVVKELKDWVKKVDEVWLATDEDREGEAISWHLAKVLKLDLDSTKRISFREITKPALQKAIQNPGTVDIDLVNAQQARRVLDRLVGFELSGLLWRKVRGKLSAGRVQSVAVKLVVERERAINSFDAKPFFKVAAIFEVEGANGKKVHFKANLNKNFDSEQNAQQFLEQCTAATYQVGNIAVKPAYRKPAAPFTTSTLQQEASRKLGFSVSRTMSVAQRLYEAGHITYMRTDSTTLSETALGALADTIKKFYGDNYLNTKQYKNNKASAQEAHEAIRPTYAEKNSVSMGNDENRLYELIWKRTIASQMANAQLQKTTIDINISTVSDVKLVAVGQVLKFDGFLKVYLESKEEEEDNEDNNNEDKILPPMQVGQVLDLGKMDAIERFTRPKPHYTEASLVKKLEELGIGRPSTYAPTISRIMDPNRGYVLKQTRLGKDRAYKVLSLNGKDLTIQAKQQTEHVGYEKNKLFASDLGMQVTDFLSEHFSDIMEYSFTAGIEDQLDIVAEGREDWVKMLDDIYKPFHQTVEHTLENADRVTGERILGKDPKTGLSILVRIGRYGPIAQIGLTEELGEEKPQYANLKEEQSIETITLEDALDLFQFPKTLGNYKDLEVVIGEGRYGPFVKYDGAFISIPRTEDVHQVDMDRAVELILEKQKADAPIGYYQEKPITKGQGRFGPFVKWEGLFCSITKGSGFQLETITEEEAIVLVKAKIEKEANRYIHKWDDEGLSVQNGRWGPFIKIDKDRKNYKLLNKKGEKMTQDEAKEVSLEYVIQQIEEQGGVLKKKKKATKKKPAAKKKATKKKTSKTGASKTTTKK
ncbi:type I DNA topoisomerase [Aureispira anguillae]|uniref:DNA topoisomerase 1 n=1 Tax=Aureispira anguillae TaxID=2864201 RepID=A0A915YC69_9BACT|nr:type I DNA topoisomerase [Aureispira anguillae]BDS10398.1 type I DNA topoisomerase [Aureispira anguillae]